MSNMGAIPKFNFIPERQLLSNAGSNYEYQVAIYSKPTKGREDKVTYNTNLIFTKLTVDAQGLGGKLIRFYGDKEKKTIGWAILDKTENIAELEGVKQFVLNSADICTFGITKLLKALGIEVKEKRNNIPVLVYKSNLQSHPIYYIKL